MALQASGRSAVYSFVSSRRRHTRLQGDWSSDVCSSDLEGVDQPALHWHQPGLGENENREGDLNSGATPMVLLVDRDDKQSPAILEVGDHHHADDADPELDQTDRRRRRSTLDTIV